MGWPRRLSPCLEIPNDFNMHSDAVFNDTFTGAIKRLFGAMQKSGNSLKVQIYRPNKVIEVSEKMKTRILTPILTVLMLALMGACSAIPKNVHEQTIRTKREALRHSTTPMPVRIVQRPYLGATPVKMQRRETLPPVFMTPVTLTAYETLPDFAQRISSMLPLRVQIRKESQKPQTNTPELKARIGYAGTLQGLLDTLAARFNMGWDYNQSNGLVVFSRFKTRLFTLNTPPGKVGFEGTITNKSDSSKNNASSSVGGGQSVSSSDMGAETAQSSFNSFEIDVWAEVEKAVKSMLSEDGKVVVTSASGTIMVTDTPLVLDRVARHIDELNNKLSRQVALSVKVWALELNNETSAGFNIQKAILGSSASLASTGAAPYRNLDGVGSITAAILDGKMKGSSMVLQALRQFGRTTLVTSGSGISMNNMPLPVQVISRDAYLAGMNTIRDDISQTTEMTSGEIATGFSMVVTPHILERRQVILQYNVTLSSLRELEEFSSGDSKIQLPKISTRSFSQRVTMNIGQTLILGGFEQEQRFDSKGLGLMAGGKSGEYGKSIIVVTIDVADAEV